MRDEQLVELLKSEQTKEKMNNSYYELTKEERNKIKKIIIRLNVEYPERFHEDAFNIVLERLIEKVIDDKTSPENKLTYKNSLPDLLKELESFSEKVDDYNPEFDSYDDGNHIKY